VAEHLRVPFDEVEAALARGSRAPHRMARVETPGGTVIVDDTYNASPESVAAALDFLAEAPLASGRRRYAVLGDMLELGPDEERLHRAIGARAARMVDALVVVGERGRWIGQGARDAGLRRVSSAADADEALTVVERELAPGVGDLLLVKGSRGIELDRLVTALAGGGG
jgi:UDP-N-acetylmuramoyl-tripeptide--D-alanyl-D-alanine ligase